jgi:hypothetical protein
VPARIVYCKRKLSIYFVIVCAAVKANKTEAESEGRAISSRNLLLVGSRPRSRPAGVAGLGLYLLLSSRSRRRAVTARYRSG